MMTQAKNGDGFTPIGPWIETDLDPTRIPMTVHVNGNTGRLLRHRSTRPQRHRDNSSTSPAT